MKSCMRPINGQKLKDALKNRGLVAQQVSVALGADRNYIASCINRGAMNNIIVTGIDRQYNIPYEEYMPVTEPEPVEEVQKIVSEVVKTEEEKVGPIDYELLYKTIYKAVYRGTKRALSE